MDPFMLHFFAFSRVFIKIVVMCPLPLGRLILTFKREGCQGQGLKFCKEM